MVPKVEGLKCRILKVVPKVISASLRSPKRVHRWVGTHASEIEPENMIPIPVHPLGRISNQSARADRKNHEQTGIFQERTLDRFERLSICLKGEVS